jgi:hypothetical protein
MDERSATQMLEAIRLIAVERVHEGRGTFIGYCLLRVQSNHHLQMAYRGGQTGNGNDPRLYGLDGLWTRTVVADLIERKFGFRLGLTAIGELLAKHNPTPQKPLQPAYQRDPKASAQVRPPPPQGQPCTAAA